MRMYFALGLVISCSALGAAQASSENSLDALTLLQKSSRQYLNVETYKINQEETFSSEHPPDPAPSVMTAMEAPSHRYRFEADIGLGKEIRVSDGRFTWFYRAPQSAFTQLAADDAMDFGKPEIPLWPDELGIKGALYLRERLARFAEDYKSAVKLTDAAIVLQGKPIDCYVLELSNENLKTPQPFPFMQTVWIEKESLKIRKIVENYITTSQTPGLAPITFPVMRSTTYPEVMLNEPIPDGTFEFTPPANSKLVTAFSDHQLKQSVPMPVVRQAPEIVFKSQKWGKPVARVLTGASGTTRYMGNLVWSMYS